MEKTYEGFLDFFKGKSVIDEDDPIKYTEYDDFEDLYLSIDHHRVIDTTFDDDEMDKIRKFTGVIPYSRDRFVYKFTNAIGFGLSDGTKTRYSFECRKKRTLKPDSIYILTMTKNWDDKKYYDNKSVYFKCENLSTCFHLINKYKK